MIQWTYFQIKNANADGNKVFLIEKLVLIVFLKINGVQNQLTLIFWTA